MNIPVTDVVAGDVIVRHDTDITVEWVETFTPETPEDRYCAPMVRVHGRITKGYGRSSKLHSWTYHTDQTVDVDRGEERYVFTRHGAARRVR